MFFRYSEFFKNFKKSPTPDAGFHFMIFSICFTVLFLALGMGKIDWLFQRIIAEKTGLPGLCMFRNVTHLPCPGCGLTRSFVSAAHGDFALSLHFHRFGWLLIAYTFLQMLRHAGWLTFAGRRLPIERFGLWLDRFLIPIAVLLILNWFYTLARIYGMIS